MNQHQRILNTISAIRDSHSQMENIFLQGSCLNLFCILRTIYPQAQPWFNIDHIITEIDGRYYDITGQVSNKRYLRFTEFYNRRRTSRSFTRMFKAEYPLIDTFKTTSIMAPTKKQLETHKDFFSALTLGMFIIWVICALICMFAFIFEGYGVTKNSSIVLIVCSIAIWFLLKIIVSIDIKLSLFPKDEPEPVQSKYKQYLERARASQNN